MDQRESLASAVAALRKTAASQLARKEKIEADLSRLETLQRELSTSRDAVHPGTERDRLDAGLAELEERLLAVRADLGLASADLQATLDELKEAQGLDSRLERATLKREVQALTGADPLTPTAEAVALDNVRAAIEEMEARAEVIDELGGARRPPLQSEELREARAREELERLKAERREKGPATGKDTPSEPARKKPKRTL